MITKEEILKILEEEIRGDGQGYPDQGERIAAADRIWKLVEPTIANGPITSN